MKPVEQTITGKGGNCFQACVASVLELPLETVPHFCEDDTPGKWYTEFCKWLEPMNLYALIFEADGLFVPRGYALLGAESPRGPWLHSVVCYNGQIVWDPHPSREQGVGVWKDWTIFQVLDPSKPIGAGCTQGTQDGRRHR